MSDRVVTVTHCGECPAYGQVANLVTPGGEELRAWGGICRLISRRIWRDDPERPEWCPLEQGPVMIHLREERGT